MSDLFRWRPFPEQLPELLAKVRRVLVLMNGDRVLHGGFQKFFLGVCAQGKRAVHFARIFATVNVFTAHVALRLELQ
jgi:hypothetical protein